MAKKKYYTVLKGRVPGIYSSWSEAEAQVKGYGGARYKGFATRTEAQQWLENPGDIRAARAPRKIGRSKPNTATVACNDINDHELLIFTDGGAIGNPGPGGYGTVLLRKNGIVEISEGFRLTTNNRMELLACIIGLRKITHDDKKITLYSDSSYVVNGISKGWATKWRKNDWRKSDGKPVLNQDLWSELLALAMKHEVLFRWIKGHAGNTFNERCDRLAVQAAKKTEQLVDVAYERAIAID